mmetsp:Transcript_31892/g.57997  ORF Transcript_31892/g.57997 Transcript_31892/m.57997 type:complete len:247 (+) Transcript_31892:349-1089(+)
MVSPWKSYWWNCLPWSHIYRWRNVQGPPLPQHSHPCSRGVRVHCSFILRTVCIGLLRPGPPGAWPQCRPPGGAVHGHGADLHVPLGRRLVRQRGRGHLRARQLFLPLRQGRQHRHSSRCHVPLPRLLVHGDELGWLLICHQFNPVIRISHDRLWAHECPAVHRLRPPCRHRHPMRLLYPGGRIQRGADVGALRILLGVRRHARVPLHRLHPPPPQSPPLPDPPHCRTPSRRRRLRLRCAHDCRVRA